MSAVEDLGMYLHLARASAARKQPWVRDRMLVIAAAAASQMKLPAVAAFCRQQILENNPGHLISRFTTVERALASGRFQHFYDQLLRRYPREKAEHMLESLGIQIAREREAYFSDQEYAASLLGVAPAELEVLEQQAAVANAAPLEEDFDDFVEDPTLLWHGRPRRHRRLKVGIVAAILLVVLVALLSWAVWR
jgi:hypothetical protein